MLNFFVKKFKDLCLLNAWMDLVDIRTEWRSIGMAKWLAILTGSRGKVQMPLEAEFIS